MALVFCGISRFCTWVFYFKDYNIKQISGKKMKFRHFWWLAPQKAENGTFSGKFIKNYKFHVYQVTNKKITSSVLFT